MTHLANLLAQSSIYKVVHQIHVRSPDECPLCRIHTVDAAKEGGFGGAIEHVASKIPVVDKLANAAKSGNMLHYVSASLVFGSDSDRATRYLNNDTPEMRPAPKFDDNPNSAESLSEHLNFNNERS